MKKKLLSLLLVASMLVAVLPIFAVSATANDGNDEAPANYADLYVQDGLLSLVTMNGITSTEGLTDHAGRPITILAADGTGTPTYETKDNGLYLGANAQLNIADVVALPEDEVATGFTYQFVFALKNDDFANKAPAKKSQFSWEGAYAVRNVFTAGPLNVLVEPIASDIADSLLENKTDVMSDYQFAGGVSKSYLQLFDSYHSDYDRSSVLPRLMTFDYDAVSSLTFTGATKKIVQTMVGKGENGADLVVTTYGGYLHTIYRNSDKVSVNPNRFVTNDQYISSSTALIAGNDMPMVLYSIRAYDRELTTLEIQQNNFADIASYYQLNLQYFNPLDDFGKQMIYAAFASKSISELSAYEAQALLDNTYNNIPDKYRYSYDHLFVKDGLVAELNFNNVTESTACKETEFEQGGKVIAQYLPYSPTSTGAYTWAYGNGYLQTGLNGALDMSSVMEGLTDYTVQVTMAHNSTSDDDLFASSNRPAIDPRRNIAKRVSMIHVGALCYDIDFNEKTAATDDRSGVKTSSLRLWDGSTYTPTAIMTLDDKTDASKTVFANPLNSPFNYTISQKVDGGKATVSVYAKATLAGSTDVTLPAADAQPPKSLVFGAVVNTNIYSVRVYNRALSEQEIKQNHFAELASKLYISPVLFEKLSNEQKSSVYDTYANVSLFDTTLTKEAIETQIAKIYSQHNLKDMASLLVSFKGFQMATSDDVALRPLFATDKALVSLALQNASVSIGIVYAPAGTALPTVSVGDKVTASAGATLVEYYANGVKNSQAQTFENNVVARFTAKIQPTDYNTEYVCRAYVALKTADATEIVYCDTASALFGESVSTTELATYFYQEGYTTGGIKTVYDAANAQ